MKLVSWKPHVLRVGNFAKMVNDNQKHLVITDMIELDNVGTLTKKPGIVWP